MPQSDGHVAVPAEIEIYLERVAYSGEPRQPPVKPARSVQAIGKHLVHDVARGVRYQYLFRKTDDEAAYAGLSLISCAAAAVYLRGDVMIFDDRPRDELREEGYIEQQLCEIARTALRFAVDIYRVREPLECEERYADGQDDPRERDGCSEQGVYVADEKIRVLEDAEYAEIENDGERKYQAAASEFTRQEQAGYVVDEYRCEKQRQIDELPECVEHKAA